MRTITLPDRETVASYAADRVAAYVDRHPDAALGMAGGSTPAATHRHLASHDLSWGRTVLWMTDERWVHPDDGQSNQRMVRETLVDATGAPFLAPDTTMDDPEHAAASFADTLVTSGVVGGRPSLVMLGMGTDGHTASLFPDSDALDADGAYVATWVAQHDTWRLTTTYSMLATTDEILFLVTGPDKAEMVAAIASGVDVPAAHVEAAGSVAWILDEAAAHRLPAHR